MSSELHDTDPEARPPEADTGTPGSEDRPSGELPTFDLGRWRVIERIGSGGMGVVYRAVDAESGGTVAVKFLHRSDPAALLRLKAEFRAVSHLAHENLALLHELVAEGDRWFLVMEYVDGTSFFEHVRGVVAAGSLGARQQETVVGGSATRGGWSEPELAPPLDDAGEERLREVMRQLARGVVALHEGGKLHRDLKPSNVLVAHDGRVVVLDFGLAQDLGHGTRQAATSAQAPEGSPRGAPRAGTPAYMAPEQALGGPTTPASDWYAVGVMLFEALTGHLPFAGDPSEVLASKVRHEAFPPSATSASVPPDLDALCADLLRIDPAARPLGPEVLQRLGTARGSRDARMDAVPGPRASSRASPPAAWSVSWSAEVPPGGGERTAPTQLDGSTSASGDVSGERPARREDARDGGSSAPGSVPPAPTVPIIGRASELEALETAFRDAARGEAVAVLVDGPSGVGKTALVRAFADVARRQHGALVLEGRCYERESVPYKAFDALVDALERELGALPRERRAEVLPPGLHALARIFPVLREVAVLASESAASTSASAAGPDPQELQARAFRCLKLLLARMAGVRPLVLVIDDLQWGDGDSGRLLGELLTPPDRPAMLLVCTLRSDGGQTPMLRAIEGGELLEGVRAVHVGPLGALDTRELARSLLAPSRLAEAAWASDDAVDAIAREAHGLPFFVEQLVRHAEAGGREDVSLGGLLAARVGRLPPDARRLLEVIAVAGCPIEQGVAASAAGLLDARPALSLLRSGSLVRTRGARPGDPVEAYHDRIRTSVVADLGEDERARTHLALAAALDSTPGSDRRDLAHHLHAGGDRQAAFVQAMRAGDEAAGGLAFDRAAELYRLALGCDLGSREERASLQGRAADALSHAGHCAEAAPLYLAASAGSSGDAAWELRRRAAEQLLVSGDIDAGVRVLRPVLADVGISFPASPRAALLEALARVAHIELRAWLAGGLSAGARPPRSSTLELRRFDACWSAGKGLLSVDPMRGAYFFVRALRVAIDSGEPHRIARSLAIYGMLQVFEGDAGGHARGSRVLDEAEALARGLDDPYLRGMVSNCQGTARMSVGQWRQGLDRMEAGIAELEQRCTDVAWDIGVTRSSCFNTRLWMGEVRTIAETAPAWHRAAARVGNRFAEVTSDLYTAFGELAAGDPAGARRRVHRAIGRWSCDGFHFQHWLALKVEIWCDLYEGHPEAAWARLDAAWPLLEASGLLRVQLMAIDCLLLRGLLGAATVGVDGRREGRALRDAAALEKLGRPTAFAAARLLRGQVELARGRLLQAQGHLGAAAAGFEAADVQLHAECARRRLGELRGGDMGRALVARVDRWMTQQGIVDPARFSGAFAPVAGEPVAGARATGPAAGSTTGGPATGAGR